jgi:hypothetical protein
MSDLDLNPLRSTREDFIRVDTLCSANDIVSNHIHLLPIFRQWDLMDNKILADADGQKFSTTDSTLQSRYSRKYLGKGRGISLYTLIANYVAVNAKNIGLNEYEGHSLYDMVYNNKTDIDIHMVTGDNHSLNQLNFCYARFDRCGLCTQHKKCKERGRRFTCYRGLRVQPYENVR